MGAHLYNPHLIIQVQAIKKEEFNWDLGQFWNYKEVRCQSGPSRPKDISTLFRCQIPDSAYGLEMSAYYDKHNNSASYRQAS